MSWISEYSCSDFKLIYGKKNYALRISSFYDKEYGNTKREHSRPLRRAEWTTQNQATAEIGALKLLLFLQHPDLQLD
jgi:hypothetical protein